MELQMCSLAVLAKADFIAHKSVPTDNVIQTPEYVKILFGVLYSPIGMLLSVLNFSGVRA
jgi:hypothetical protein